MNEGSGGVEARTKRTTMTMISPTATIGDKACCWICLEEGNDDHGQPLTRNCACRGDSGWAHVACLARFAKVRTDDLSTEDFTEWKEIIDSDNGTPWSVCHTCKHEYHGDVATSLAKEWVDSVAGLDDVSPHRIAAMLNFANTSLQNKAFDLAIQTCEDLRGTLHTTNVQYIDSSFRFIVDKKCLLNLVRSNAGLGNKEKGLEYAEKLMSFDRKLGLLAMGLCDPNPVSVENIFSSISSQNQGGDPIRILTDMYNSAVQTFGKDSPTAINMAAGVAQAMFGEQNIEESYQWIKDTHDRAKRVFGKQNPEYINIKRLYLAVGSKCGPRKGTLALNNSKLNGKEVTILRATKDGKKYIVVIGSEAGLSEKVKVTPSQLIFAADTLVTDKAMVEDRTLFVDSFDKKTDSYKVFAMYGVEDDDDYAYLDVPRKDVAVMFRSRFSGVRLGV